jgi:hypothetical protein
MEVLKLILVKMFTYERQFFLLTHDLLQDSRIIYRLPNSYSYFFFLRVAKLNKCTYEALLNICSFVKPFVQSKPHHPRYFFTKTLLKNISSVITMALFACLCAFHLVSAGFQKCSLM